MDIQEFPEDSFLESRNCNREFNCRNKNDKNMEVFHKVIFLLKYTVLCGVSGMKCTRRGSEIYCAAVFVRQMEK